MSWLEVVVITDGEGAEAVAEALRPFAYQDSVVLEQLGDDSNPAPDAMEPTVTVKIYAPAEKDTAQFRRKIEEILAHLGMMYPLPPPTFRILKEKDWANAWKKHYHPLRIGNRIWIQPSWLPGAPAPDGDMASADDLLLVLDPGMAFGTGLHPTTQMCLQGLEQVMQPGMEILDVGTGSGILAIAAVKLGANKVVAVDTDELAVKTAVANTAQNGVDGFIEIYQGSLQDIPARKWDILVVNILASVIISLIKEGGLLNYVNSSGYLILSGITDQQTTAVETAVAVARGTIYQQLTIRDWVSYIVQPV